jgi:hypothetical protein
LFERWTAIGGAITLCSACVPLYWLNRREFGLALILVAVLFVILLTPWLSEYFRRERWHLVPGGVVLIRGRMFPRVSLITRNEAILFQYADRLILAPCNGERPMETRALSEDCTAAIRAWLCPVPPPSLQEVRRWFGVGMSEF